jgi:hypothetical protein
MTGHVLQVAGERFDSERTQQIKALVFLIGSWASHCLELRK